MHMQIQELSSTSHRDGELLWQPWAFSISIWHWYRPFRERTADLRKFPFFFFFLLSKLMIYSEGSIQWHLQTACSTWMLHIDFPIWLKIFGPYINSHLRINSFVSGHKCQHALGCAWMPVKCLRPWNERARNEKKKTCSIFVFGVFLQPFQGC